MATKFRMISLMVALVALLAVAVVSVGAAGFTHGTVIRVDGEEYYMAGVSDGPGDATDVPGHYWVQAGPNMVQGKHYNTGPFGAAQWWSSDADDGELLFVVHGIIDTWSLEKAAQYAAKGYVHRHELVSVADGTEHPSKVVWLKHTARTSFTFDGGPPPAQQRFGPHEVTPGVDYEFMPNWADPYPTP